MTCSASFHKRKAFFFIVFLIVFSAFTADIVDLREELRILPCAYSSLDNNITAGIINQLVIKPEPILTLSPICRKSSAKISFLHLLSFGFRAPPPWS
jgi:hypothetical protein